MTAAEPLNETARQKALHALEILDTPPEEAFDRITRLARSIFGVPMAAISLIDQERQWFKSRIGVDFYETPRSWSFCTRTILSDEVMVVPDALRDARFAANPLVCGDPGIRFYGGAPLRTREGHNLGSLCIMDKVARPDLDARHRGILADLADVVVEECLSRRKARELESAKDNADRANRAKGEFLSRASHELRTPMNAVLGFTQLLEMDDLTDSQQSSVDRILKAGRHLLKLVNEVLDISRIEAGGRAIELEPVKIADALREAAEFVEPMLQENEINLRIEPASACSVLADQQKLVQVFLNLFSNAIKYNRANGSVTVTQEVLGDQVRIRIADTGNGISPEQQSKLFQPFERLGAERTKIQGTGLGLALCKKIVELMGGSIGVESVPGSGSTFWIQLPRFDTAPLEPARQPVESKPATGPTVLYIEDAVVSIHLIRGILKRTKLHGDSTIRLISAMQGNLGLEMARLHAPDLILLDLHLPDMSGIQVLNQLKADARTSSIPVVVLTADPLPGTQGQVRDAGAAACLAKPVEVAQFMETVRHILEEPTI
jgi:signal transduction histidine kinase/CheY-like chemotaxis protein